jgi:hypothetical protein
MSLRTAVIPIAVLLCGLAGGCATESPPPTEEVTRARTVIEDADKAGAQRYAAADLQRAHDELSDAEKANANGQYSEARRYAESAEVDADVATARASDGAAERAATEVAQGNETLREESGRSAPTTTPTPNPQ